MYCMHLCLHVPAMTNGLLIDSTAVDTSGHRRGCTQCCVHAFLCQALCAMHTCVRSVVSTLVCAVLLFRVTSKSSGTLAGAIKWLLDHHLLPIWLVVWMVQMVALAVALYFANKDAELSLQESFQEYSTALMIAIWCIVFLEIIAQLQKIRPWGEITVLGLRSEPDPFLEEQFYQEQGDRGEQEDEVDPSKVPYSPGITLFAVVAQIVALGVFTAAQVQLMLGRDRDTFDLVADAVALAYILDLDDFISDKAMEEVELENTYSWDHKLLKARIAHRVIVWLLTYAIQAVTLALILVYYVREVAHTRPAPVGHPFLLGQEKFIPRPPYRRRQLQTAIQPGVIPNPPFGPFAYHSPRS